MIQKLTKHGEDLALVLDQEMLKQLQIDQETLLEVFTDGESLIISPARDGQRKKSFRDALDSVKAQYGNTLKKLGE